MDTLTKNNRSKLPPKPLKTIPDARLLRLGAPRSFHIYSPRLTTSLRVHPKNILPKNFAQGWSLKG